MYQAKITQNCCIASESLKNSQEVINIIGFLTAILDSGIFSQNAQGYTQRYPPCMHSVGAQGIKTTEKKTFTADAARLVGKSLYRQILHYSI